jgi:two-component system OmpR family response regulator
VERLLLVEDDERIARFVKRGLEAEGYSIEIADNGEDGLELARTGDYPLMILDRMLPGMDGIEVCDTLRRERSPCLVLMLTAKDSLQDKVRGLHVGADDYLTKPFAFDELLARIRALLRRSRPGREQGSAEILRVGDLLLDGATRKARRGEREITLTVKEYMLLAYLMENAGQVVSRARILSNVWGYSFDPGSKVVDVYVRYLRQKVDDGEAKPLIKTVRGFGYTISDE